MGLDISVIRPIKLNKELEDSYRKGEEIDGIKIIELDCYFDKIPINDINWNKYIKPYVKDLEVDLFDLNSMKSSIGIPENELKDWDVALTGPGCIGFENSLTKEYKEYLYSDYSKIPTILGTITVISGEIVGYQRKGANSKFYEDDKWGSLIYCKEDLDKYEKEYFSFNTSDIENHHTEYDLSDEEMRSRFKKNIVDKFTEGCMVLFD